jgi:hypothetical protein
MGETSANSPPDAVTRAFGAPTIEAMLARLVVPVVVLVLALVTGSGRAAGSPAVTPPPPGGAFSYQIGGAFPPAPGVTIVDRDRRDAPARGAYGVCYVNAFQVQPDERAWWRARHPTLLLTRHGRPVVDRNWNEQLLDTSTAAKRRALARVVGGWMAGCVRAGYRAVEPDNLDSWTRSHGALTVRDDLALARLLIARAHALGLAIAQKNAAEVAPAGRRLGFDFAIAEECQAYDECDAYTRVYGREVIEIEYRDNGGASGFAAACAARGAEISLVYRDRDVTPAGRPGFVEHRCT